jgi:hypothetical protein
LALFHFKTLSLISFTNFTMKKLRLIVSRVDCLVWLVEQLQLHKNEIFVGTLVARTKEGWL